jgi:hypothetical protein
MGGEAGRGGAGRVTDDADRCSARMDYLDCRHAKVRPDVVHVEARGPLLHTAHQPAACSKATKPFVHPGYALGFRLACRSAALHAPCSVGVHDCACLRARVRAACAAVVAAFQTRYVVLRLGSPLRRPPLIARHWPQLARASESSAVAATATRTRDVLPDIRERHERAEARLVQRNVDDDRSRQPIEPGRWRRTATVWGTVHGPRCI